MSVQVYFPEAFQGLFVPARYKVFYGGRGGAKSWQFARALLLRGSRQKIRVLCVREVQNSIADSVHKLLCEQIVALGLGDHYRITNSRIIGLNGTEFIFCGLRANIREIKSKEGIDVCWVEEAESVTDDSWNILIPTIRKLNSEIWVSFNPLNLTDPTYQRFVVNTPPDTIIQPVSWRDNPWFPAVLAAEREYMKRINYDMYLHVWEGKVRTINNAVVFQNKFVVESFNTPDAVRYYHGADWGFAKDPTVLVRGFIGLPTERYHPKDTTCDPFRTLGTCLFVDAEVFGVGVELDNTPQLFRKMPTALDWVIKADNSRPETIRFMRNRGFNVLPARKWNGSVEDGISILKGFDKIVVHPRCRHLIDELRNYSYKVDKHTNEILPVLVDAKNHCIDALRYSLDSYIRGRKAAKTVRKPRGM